MSVTLSNAARALHSTLEAAFSGKPDFYHTPFFTDTDPFDPHAAFHAIVYKGHSEHNPRSCRISFDLAGDGGVLRANVDNYNPLIKDQYEAPTLDDLNAKLVKHVLAL